MPDLNLSLTDRAARIMVAAHAGQVRKTDDSPYIVHPVAVALTLARHGFAEPVIAAALVHDVLEDTAYPEAQLRAELGDEVWRIVSAVTEDKTLPWEFRKQEFLRRVGEGSEAVKAVALADKIHNLESILAGHAQHGPALWEKFTRGREQKLAMEERLVAVFQASWHHPLVDEYTRLWKRVRQLV